MKKRILILALAILFSLTACSQTPETPEEPAGQEDREDREDQEDQKDQEEPENPDDDSKEPEEGNNGEPSGPVSESTKITVYCGNEDAAEFDLREAEISSLTPEEVLDALVGEEAVSEEVKVLSFNKSTVDGRDTLVLDLNSAFSAYVLSKGTAGEYYAVGSVCNTFLEAFYGDQIKITVEGAALETGHGDYSEIGRAHV